MEEEYVHSKSKNATKNTEKSEVSDEMESIDLNQETTVKKVESIDFNQETVKKLDPTHLKKEEKNLEIKQEVGNLKKTIRDTVTLDQKQKKLCERWLDHLFIVLYEDLKGFLTHKNRPNSVELLADLSFKLYKVHVVLTLRRRHWIYIKVVLMIYL